MTKKSQNKDRNCDIHKKIDKILLEKQPTLQRHPKKDVSNHVDKLQFKHFSPNHKHTQSIYYVAEKKQKTKKTKKQKKKEQQNIDEQIKSETLSYEIMSTAREKLGEEPPKYEEVAMMPEEPPANVRVKRRIAFGKKKPDIDRKIEEIDVELSKIGSDIEELESKPTKEEGLKDFKEKYSDHLTITEEKQLEKNIEEKSKKDSSEKQTPQQTEEIETKIDELPTFTAERTDEEETTIIDEKITATSKPPTHDSKTLETQSQTTEKKHRFFKNKKQKTIKEPQTKSPTSEEDIKREVDSLTDKNITTITDTTINDTIKENKPKLFGRKKQKHKKETTIEKPTITIEKDTPEKTETDEIKIINEEITDALPNQSKSNKQKTKDKKPKLFGRKKAQQKDINLAEEPTETTPALKIETIDESTPEEHKEETKLIDTELSKTIDHKTAAEDKKDHIEQQATDMAKKHRFFGKKKPKPKNDINIADFSKDTKSQKTKSFPKTDDKTELEETKLIDEEITESVHTKTGFEDKDFKVEQQATDIAKKHKMFGKKKDEKEIPPGFETIETKETIKAGESEFKFKVENLPDTDEISTEEEQLIDEGINDVSLVGKEEKPKKDTAKAKAKTLAEKHIEEPEKKPLFVPDQESKDGFKNAEPLSDENKGVEHVFFDEADTGTAEPFLIEPELDENAPDFTPAEPLPEVPLDEVKPESGIELPKEALQVKSLTLENLGFSKKEWEELDFYPLYEPFSYVEILREKESFDKRYFLVEVDLNDTEKKALEFVEETMKGYTIDTLELESKGEVNYFEETLNDIIEEYCLNLSDESKQKIIYYLEKKCLGLDKLEPLMKDPNIEDISCDGSETSIFLYHRRYGSLKSNITFKSEDELAGFVIKLAQKCGKHISVAEPILDATMPDGSRIQMTLSTEVTTKGSTFTIRKFKEDPFSPPDLLEFNTMSPEMMAYMWIAVENGVNALIAGGTASGKTSTLNALSLFIPRESKIVSIEETREINLPHPNWIPGVARSGFGEVVGNKMVGEIDMFDLMKAALRQRPEYILVGEIRGREAYVLFQAMATGHTTYSTAHADSAQSLIHRLEGKPINIPRIMLQALDIVSIQVTTRVQNKRARRCKQIIEIIDIDPVTKEILTNEVFRWDPVEDSFTYSGKSYVLERIRAEKDLSREAMTMELKNRATLIDWMNTQDIRDFRRVATLVSQYTERPEETMKQINKGKK